MSVVAIDSGSPEETERIGVLLGKLLSPGDFIALKGELGGGKTRFAKGVATGIGVSPDMPVTSPTYTLMNIYAGRIPLYHFDLYRLSGDDDAVDLGFADYFAGEGASLVEWPERLSEELPAERLEILFSYTGESERRLELLAMGKRYEQLLDYLTGSIKMFEASKNF